MKKSLLIGLSILTLAGCQSAKEADAPCINSPCRCQTAQTYTETFTCGAVQTVRKDSNTVVQYRTCTKQMTPANAPQASVVVQPTAQHPVMGTIPTQVTTTEQVGTPVYQPHPCARVSYNK